ncbi:MAG TPA: mannitol-1-phosphate 5-dehydrogenase [Caldilineae bacterium]|nr:mannitol-1-phosphate 5-dehydrogenase [Caldilineae bacterium]
MNERPARQALIFGAGSVGRGFLGHLLHDSGYELVFVDIDERLLRAINERQGYTLRLAGLDHVEDLHIGPVRGIHADDQEAISQALVEADLVVTAVGARSLSAVAASLAVGLVSRARYRPEAPLNIIICENVKHAASFLRQAIRRHLLSRLHDYLERRVGFVMSVIARMVTSPPPEIQAVDPTLIIAEPYRRLFVNRHGFVGRIPDIVGLEPLDHFSAWVDWKLYIHNAGHAVLGYLGYLRGYTYGYEALDDPAIALWVRRAMRESAQALAIEHGFDRDALEAQIQDLLRRFANRHLKDPIVRLARDPLRKLAPSDRLVGAATLCWRHRIRPDALTLGIAAALMYDAPSDLEARRLQDRLWAKGVDGVLQEVCGLKPDDELVRMIRARYQKLHSSGIPIASVKED